MAQRIAAATALSAMVMYACGLQGQDAEYDFLETRGGQGTRLYRLLRAPMATQIANLISGKELETALPQAA